jgi:hypothetical protein
MLGNDLILAKISFIFAGFIKSSNVAANTFSGRFAVLNVSGAVIDGVGCLQLA